MPGEYSRSNWEPALLALRGNLLQASADWATQVQERMRSDAPWTDRGGRDSYTGLTARQSLEAEAGLSDDETEIVIVARTTRESTRPWQGFAHAPVGGFLELGTSRMRQRYQVIWPTLVNMQPELARNLMAAVGVNVGW